MRVLFNHAYLFSLHLLLPGDFCIKTMKSCYRIVAVVAFLFRPILPHHSFSPSSSRPHSHSQSQRRRCLTSARNSLFPFRPDGHPFWASERVSRPRPLQPILSTTRHSITGRPNLAGNSVQWGLSFVDRVVGHALTRYLLFFPYRLMMGCLSF